MGDTLRIGVIGYGLHAHFSEVLATRHLHSAFDQIVKKHPNARNTCVVSKLINAGVPRLAYAIARERSWKIAGIAPTAIPQEDWYPMEASDVSLIGGEWGQESGVFLSRVDVLVRVGGGMLERMESTHFKKRPNAEVYEYELDLLPGRPRQ